MQKIRISPSQIWAENAKNSFVRFVKKSPKICPQVRKKRLWERKSDVGIIPPPKEWERKNDVSRNVISNIPVDFPQPFFLYSFKILLFRGFLMPFVDSRFTIVQCNINESTLNRVSPNQTLAILYTYYETSKVLSMIADFINIAGLIDRYFGVLSMFLAASIRCRLFLFPNAIRSICRNIGGKPYDKAIFMLNLTLAKGERKKIPEMRAKYKKNNFADLSHKIRKIPPTENGSFKEFLWKVS